MCTAILNVVTEMLKTHYIYVRSYNYYITKDIPVMYVGVVVLTSERIVLCII